MEEAFFVQIIYMSARSSGTAPLVLLSLLFKRCISYFFLLETWIYTAVTSVSRSPAVFSKPFICFHTNLYRLLFLFSLIGGTHQLFSCFHTNLYRLLFLFSLIGGTHQLFSCLLRKFVPPIRLSLSLRRCETSLLTTLLLFPFWPPVCR